MIISKTPYRISFFGGGTDYPAWYLKEGGAVLSTSIDKYCYITCRRFPPFFNIKHRIVWSHIEAVSSLSEILHPVVREGCRYLGFDDSEGLEIHHQGDLPARTGVGSSSSFTVGLINALSALKGQAIDKHELAMKAIELEQTVLKETVGSQDQMAAAYGGFNVIRFFQDGHIDVQEVPVTASRLQELESSLMLLYTGTTRIASQVASQMIANIPAKASVFRRMARMVDESVSIVCGAGSLDPFGELLHEAWLLKRSTCDLVSTPEIDHIYEIAGEHGAVGGKLLGAGSSGFMVFYAPPEHQPAVRRALSNYLWVPFSFECDGSAILYRESNPVLK